MLFSVRFLCIYLTCELPVSIEGLLSKADKEDLLNGLIGLQEFPGLTERYLGGFFEREPICARTDRWKGDTRCADFNRGLETIPVTTRQKRFFISVPAPPDRPCRMDHPFGRKPVS